MLQILLAGLVTVLLFGTGMGLVILNFILMALIEVAAIMFSGILTMVLVGLFITWVISWVNKWQ